jgi:hypothetical protein
VAPSEQASTGDVAPAPRDAPPRRLPWWACLLIGIASAVVGLLPWLITGMRLPLQNLWATETLPDEMPIVLLPFNQYALTLLVAILVTGAAVAGITARAIRPRRPRFGVVATLVGVLAVQVVAVVQTTIVVEAGLQERSESTLYLAALVAVAALSVLVGLLVLLLVAAAPRAGAVVGLCLAAVLSSSWFSGIVVPFGTVQTVEFTGVLSVLRWIPPILVGAAIAWGGVNTVGRVLAAVFGLIVLWIAPALITAVVNAAGSRVLARDPRAMAEYAVDVFGMALTMPSLALPPLIVAVVVAATGLVGRAVLARARSRSAAPADDDR